MTSEERIAPYVELGQRLARIPEVQFQTLALDVKNQNPWFTEENVRLAISRVAYMLEKPNLLRWVEQYSFSNTPKTVSLILAGNIPMVGFHDLLCVLVSGHAAQLKLSSKDSVLMQFLIDTLIQISPGIKSRISIVERLKDFDAVIATGSDNSSRYFEYYFGKYPHIIRKNRSSVAILNGDESDDELQELGRDVFTYFGLGCRNVSKLFVPAGYSFTPLLDNWDRYKDILNHHKYNNNYDYQKSLLLINRVPFYDNGFVMLQESERFVSPISVVYYEFYSSHADLVHKLSLAESKIQIVTGNVGIATVRLGNSQRPGVSDYADNVDTMAFLSSI